MKHHKMIVITLLFSPHVNSIFPNSLHRRGKRQSAIGNRQTHASCLMPCYCIDFEKKLSAPAES